MLPTNQKVRQLPGEATSSIYTWTSIYHLSITFNLHTWIVAIASTPPEAPSKWPIMDFVELTFSCTKSTNNLLYSTHHNNLPQHEPYVQSWPGPCWNVSPELGYIQNNRNYLMACSCNSNFADQIDSHLSILSKRTHESFVLLQITSSCWGCMGIHVVYILPTYSCLCQGLLYTKYHTSPWQNKNTHNSLIKLAKKTGEAWSINKVPNHTSNLSKQYESSATGALKCPWHIAEYKHK